MSNHPPNIARSRDRVRIRKTAVAKVWSDYHKLFYVDWIQDC